MEKANNLEVEAQRKRVASFIQDSLQPAKQLLEEGSLDTVGEEVSDEARDFEYFEHQLDTWGALWHARQAGKKKALVHLATGLGKTSVAVFDAKKFRDEHIAEYGREPYVLFTCHQNSILEQAAERFAAFFPEASQGFYTGEQKDRHGEVTFATLQSLYSSLDEFKPDEFDYIVYDEAHHSKAETFEAVVKHFKPAFQLALTATPDRLDEENIRELFGDEIYSLGLAEALARRLLARPDYHIVFDDTVKKAMESGFELDTLRELNNLFSVKPRNEIIAQNIKDEMKRIGLRFGQEKTIVFCQDIDHAEEMAELLGGRAYHSGITNKKERKDILDEFRHGKLKVICTRDMFNEGVDIPDARLLVFLRSTSSQTVFEQQLGRGLRRHAGKEQVSVLDFVANVERIAMIQELTKNIRGYTYQGNGDGEGTIFDRQSEGVENSGGLHIHGDYGDFDFDRLSIDLLERFNYLKSDSVSRFIGWGNDELVTLALTLSPDRPLSGSDINKLSVSGKFMSRGSVVARFGSLSAFQQACGFEVSSRVRPSDLSDQEIVEIALSLKPDGPMTSTEIDEFSKQGKFFGSSTIRKRFGSFPAFQQACGFEVRDTTQWTNEDLLEMALSFKPGGPLETSEINDLSQQGKFVSPSNITKRFGSLSAFQQACGFEVRSTLKNETIIEMALGIKSSGPLTHDEIGELSRQGKFVGTDLIRRRFGSLAAFQQACGFEILPRPAELSNEEIVDIALRLKPGEPLNDSEIKALSKQGKFFGSSTIRKRFGSIPAFHQACGFNNASPRLSDEDIINKAVRLKPGGPLTLKEIDRLSKEGKLVSGANIKKRFGSIRAFQQACGFKPSARGRRAH